MTNKGRGRRAQDPDELVKRAIQKGLSVDRSQLDPHPVRRILRPASEKQYDRELILWEAFQRAFPGSTPQNIQTLKQYAEFLGLSKKGRLDKAGGRPTPRSIRISIRRFCNAWERANHEIIPLDVSRSMAPYIEGPLAKKLCLPQGEDGQREKAFLTIENYVHMQNRHWTNDFHDYIHEGSRVDNTNLLNIHCFTSARCQEVCQATYQDLECILSWKDGQPEFRCKFKRRICKGKDKDQPEHPFGEQSVAPDGLPPPLFAQPMLHLLANIISSNAFADLRTVEQVLAIRPPKSGNYRVITWADDAKDKPLFPEWSVDGPTLTPKNPKSWVSQFSGLAKRAGFTASQGMHSARREVLIKANDSGYSLGQVLRFASQSNTHVLVHNYFGNISTIDGTGAFLGMNLRTDLAEDFRSASMGRNPNLRFSLPTQVAEELRNSEEYLLLTKRIQDINLEIDASLPAETRQQLEAQRKAVYEERRRLEAAKLKELQACQKIEYEDDCEDCEHSDWRQSFFDRIRHVLPEERIRLAQTLKLRAWPRSPDWISALQDLISLRTNNRDVAYQKELRPIRGCCPSSSCGKQLNELPIDTRWRHVYDCMKKLHARSSGFASFCFLCSKWLGGKPAWVAHCEEHVQKLDAPLRCDPVKFHYATACAGFCPVHLGRPDLPAEERMCQFLDPTAWRRHISRCIPEYLRAQHNTTSISCPHLSCPMICRSEEDFWHHLGDNHSVEKPVSVGKRKKHPEEDQDATGPTRNAKRLDAKEPENLKILHFLPMEDTTGLQPQCLSAEDAPLDAILDEQTPKPEPLWNIGQNSLLVTGGSSDLVTPSSSRSDDPEYSDFARIEDGSFSPFRLGHISSHPEEGGYRAADLDLPPRASPLFEAALSSSGKTMPVDPKLFPVHQDSTTSTPEYTPTAETEAVEGTNTAEAGTPEVRSQPESAREEEYPVDRLLGRWGKGLYFLRWLDGSYGWEPKEHILDEELIEKFEKDYNGFRDGVQVIRTRVRNGKAEYRLHCSGRPRGEDWWVAEKFLSPELIDQHKPRKRNQRRRGGCRYLP